MPPMRHELDHVDSRGLRQDEWAATPPPPGGEPTTAAAVATASATAARHRRMTRAMVGRKGVGGRGESVSGTKEMAREGGEEGQGGRRAGKRDWFKERHGVPPHSVGWRPSMGTK